MKKILFVAHEDDLGGATKSMLTIIDALHSNKEEYTVSVLLRKKDTALSEILDEMGVNYKVYNIPWIRGVGGKAKLLLSLALNIIFAFYLVFIKRMNSSKFDIIHSNSSVVGIGFFIGAISRVKHIWHIREFGDLDFQLNYPMSNQRMFKFMCRHTEKFIFISNVLSEHYYFIPKNKKVIVYNGFDIDRYIKKFGSKEKVMGAEPLNALISGSFSRGKKQDTAIKAVKYLKDNGCNIKLFVAGKGDKDYEHELKFMVDKYNLKDRVFFLGYIQDIDELRGNMDFELVCSTSEAFGRVTVEAMLSKVIVIASDTGANTELIESGTTGMIFRYNDPKSLAESLLKCRDEELYCRLVDESFKYATRKFSKEVVIKNITKIYSEIQ